jgi:hypothetical protein
MLHYNIRGNAAGVNRLLQSFETSRLLWFITAPWQEHLDVAGDKTIRSVI